MEVNAGKCNLLRMARQEVSLKVNYWNIKDSDSKDSKKLLPVRVEFI